MKQTLVITLITSSLLLAQAAAPAQEAKPMDKPSVPAILPGYKPSGRARSPARSYLPIGLASWTGAAACATILLFC